MCGTAFQIAGELWYDPKKKGNMAGQRMFAEWMNEIAKWKSFRERPGDLISASMGTVEAIGRADGSNGSLPQSSWLQWLVPVTFHGGSYSTNLPDNEAISAEGFFHIGKDHFTWVGLVSAFPRHTWETRQKPSSCPLDSCFEKTIYLAPYKCAISKPAPWWPPLEHLLWLL